MLTSRGWRVSPAVVFIVLVVAVVAFLLTNGAWDAAAGDGRDGARMTASTAATTPPPTPAPTGGTTAP